MSVSIIVYVSVRGVLILWFSNIMLCAHVIVYTVCKLFGLCVRAVCTCMCETMLRHVTVSVSVASMCVGDDLRTPVLIVYVFIQLMWRYADG